MIKSLDLLNYSTFKENIVFIFKRFPISIFYIICLDLLFLSIIHFDLKNILEQNLLNGIFSLIIGIFLSLGMYVFSESLNLSKIKSYLLQSFVFLYTLGFYFGFSENFFDFDKILFFILNIFGIITFLFFSPFLKSIFDKKYENSLYYNYFYNISFSFFISFIFGGILFLLGALGIFSVISLFDIGSVGDKIIGDWAVFSLGFVSILFGITKIPKKDNFEDKNINLNSFFSFIVKYIMLPFIYVYFIILYIYSLKVLMNFGDWPKGEVSWLVIIFSIFGYLIYIFSYVFENENKFISFFRKLFPYVVFPQLFMLFYSIFLRINQYDLTINRYFVVVFGLWLFVISIYFIFSKNKSLIFIPLLITIFTIIISIGPWGVYSLPESRQLNLLNQNLIKANILKNSQIFPLKNENDIPQDLSKNIYSQINYLCSMNNCKSIKKMFEKEYNVFLKKHKDEYLSQNIKYSSLDYNEPNSWEIVNYLTQYLKVGNYFDESKNEVLFLENDKNIFPIDIKGFSKISKICPDCNIKINYSSKKLEIYEQKVLKKDFDISNIFKQLEENNKNKKENIMTFEIGGNKIIFQNISIKNTSLNNKDNSNYYYSYEGYFLEK